jgi:hypothetical protein
MTWDDAIKACDEYIEQLVVKLHSMDNVDSMSKEMLKEKIALAMYKRQIAVALQREDIAA